MAKKWHQHSLPILIAVGILIVCGIFITHKQAATTPPTLIVLSHLEGITEPCGCNTVPLGGLDRIAQLISQHHAKLVLLGDTFFTYALGNHLSLALQIQEQHKALAIIKIMQRLKPAWIVPGNNDSHPGNAAIWQADMAYTNAAQHMLIDNGIRIGLLRVTAQTDMHDLKQSLHNLQQSNAEFIIAMIQDDTPAIHEMISNLPDINIAIAGSSQDAAPQQYIQEKTCWVTAGNHGEYIGTLQLYPSKHAQPWVLYDPNHTQEKAAIVTNIDRFTQEVAHLPKGPAKDARLAKIAHLQAQFNTLLAHKPTPPTAPYFTWQTTPIHADLPKAPWAESILVNYNQSLCALSEQTQSNIPCAAPQPGASVYVGVATCKACHPAAAAVYEKTAHAHAWETLIHAGKTCDLSCIGCHSVGFNQPGGYCHVQDAATFANVGCENCHGPGSAHIANISDKTRWGSNFVVAPAEPTCIICHTKEHSDAFDYKTYLPRILGVGHGLKN